MFGKKALGSQMEEAIKAAGGEAVTHGVRSKYVTAEQMERLIAALGAGGGGGGGGDGGGDGGDSTPDSGSIGGYVGKDLSDVFENALALHTAIASGDFAKIHIGDYWPIKLNGTFVDAATNETKTINETVKMEVAAINPYLWHGESSSAALDLQHIVLCSRDCLTTTFKYRSGSSTWYDSTATNPWKGSALHETLNNATAGIIKLVEATELGPYLTGTNGRLSMRANLPEMASGADEPTGSSWQYRGGLFLPTELEVFGVQTHGKILYEAGNLYNQWPIFAGSSEHIMKGTGDNGTKCDWWLQTAASSSAIADVRSRGDCGAATASSSKSIPLCFILT